MPAPTGSISRSGATLVELLVALGIAVMIMSVIILAHHTLTLNSRGQQKRLQEADRALATINELRRDLQSLYVPGGDETCTVELENRTDQLVRLSFCRWEASKARGEIFTNRLEKVTFVLDESVAPPRLLRMIQCTTGPGSDQPYITNWIDAAWTRLVIQLGDGTAWKTNWPGGEEEDDAPAARPVAARILLLPDQETGQAGTEPAYETIVIIPSAMNVTSSISRAGSSSINPQGVRLSDAANGEEFAILDFGFWICECRAFVYPESRNSNHG